MLVKHSIKIENVDSHKQKAILDMFSYKEIYEKVPLSMTGDIRYKHKEYECLGYLDRKYYLCDYKTQKANFKTTSSFDFSDFEIMKERKERLIFPNLRLLALADGMMDYYDYKLHIKYGDLNSDKYFDIIDFEYAYSSNSVLCKFSLHEYINLVDFVKVISSFCLDVVFVVDESIRVCNGEIVE